MVVKLFLRVLSNQYVFANEKRFEQKRIKNMILQIKSILADPLAVLQGGDRWLSPLDLFLSIMYWCLRQKSGMKFSFLEYMYEK